MRFRVECAFVVLGHHLVMGLSSHVSRRWRLAAPVVDSGCTLASRRRSSSTPVNARQTAVSDLHGGDHIAMAPRLEAMRAARSLHRERSGALRALQDRQDQHLAGTDVGIGEMVALFDEKDELARVVAA